MDILQVFVQYGNDMLQKMRDSDYFQSIKMRNEYIGVYLFIRNYFCNTAQTRNQLKQTFDSYYPLFEETIREYDK